MIPASTQLILLDFGNVIINIDPERTFYAFADITSKDVHKIKSIFEQEQLFRRYESGHFEDHEFRDILRQALGFPFSDSEIDNAWNALLLDVPKKRVDLILDLRLKYDVRLLSNTNSIHIKACDKYFNKNFGIPSVSKLFTKAYYSFELELWKPEKEIYEVVLNDSGYSPAEVFFIDDNAANIEAAKELGIKTHLLIPPDDLINHLAF